MNRELYQLVAITKNNIEYIVELNNENKNNRGGLAFIDEGVTRFQNEQHLAHYLYEAGKIPTKNVKFAIKYNHKGPRYLPLVFYDKTLNSIAKNADNDEVIAEYAVRLCIKVETELNNSDFYEFLSIVNDENENQSQNGNYLNEYLMNYIQRYVEALTKNNESKSKKTEFRYDIIKQLLSYKQLRTLYAFYKQYINLKLNITLPEQYNKYENVPDIPDEIASAYRTSGMDGVYGIADLDELEEKGIKLR